MANTSHAPGAVAFMECARRYWPNVSARTLEGGMVALYSDGAPLPVAIVATLPTGAWSALGHRPYVATLERAGAIIGAPRTLASHLTYGRTLEGGAILSRVLSSAPIPNVLRAREEYARTDIPQRSHGWGEYMHLQRRAVSVASQHSTRAAHPAR